MGLVLFAPSTFAKSFGVSPPWIVNENIKPGSSFVYVIDLSTNDPDSDMLVFSSISGDPEISQWLTIRNKDGLVMAKGAKHLPMEVDVKIPDDAKFGKYSGRIALKLSPSERQDENVSIMLGGHISVDLEVVSYDVKDYWVKSISTTPGTEGAPVILSMKVKNLGNVPLSSVPVNVDVYDYKTDKLVTKSSASQLSGTVYPHTLKEVQMTIPVNDLEEGSYWIDVNAFKEGQSTYKNRLYLSVASDSLSNAVETSVNVADAMARKELKAAADLASAPTNDNGRSVNLRTTVTVRAPFTNQLIGIIIVLMIVLIVITGRIYTNMKGVHHKRRRRHH